MEIYMKTMPDTTKAPIPALVNWYYRDFLGVVPDRHCFSRFNNAKNPKSLVPILAPERLSDDGDGFVAEPYTVTQVAELIYYLEDEGVVVDTLGIVTIEGLMFAFVNRKKLESAKRQLASTVEFLRSGDKAKTSSDDFEVPSGW